MRGVILLISLLFCFFTSAQLVEDFSDGDFTNSPTWSGTDADYQINGSFELQLNSSVAAASYLSTPHNLADLDNKEWSFWTRQSFSPSGSNFGRVYLTASSADLSSDPDGFYLQLGEGGSNDAVRLFKCESGVHTELTAGPLGQIASSFIIGVRVVRDAAGNWEFYIDPAGGTSYSLAATVNDNTLLLGTHFGFLDIYTVSNSTNFYHDNIYVGDEILDTAPPVLMSATSISATSVDVQFDEALDQTTAETVSNYSLAPAVVISSAVLDGGDPSLVHLTLGGALTNGQSYDLSTQNIDDLSANTSGLQTVNFSYLVAEVPSPGDLIINEFMCDPSPVVGLPEVEFVEIYNRSNKILNLTNWKLGDASSDGTVQGGWLQPGDYLALTATANVDSFVVATAVTSFPSLNNTGDNIVLRDDNGITIDSISYTDDWYKDANKEGGGYSIERINPLDPCTDITDWAASNSINGGTPGQQNSIFDNTPDTGLPSIDQLIALPPNYLEIYYSEGMDSTSLADAGISTSPVLSITDHYVLTEYPSMSIIEFADNFIPSQNYTITLTAVGDCWQNTTDLTASFALPDDIVEGDLVINEILFDPVSGGSDFIEIHNASDKLLDLYNLSIANYDDDTISNIKLIEEHALVPPGGYYVLSEDIVQLQQYYASAVTDVLLEMDLPSLNNDSSTVYLIDNTTILDKVSYSDDWHFRLLDDKEGKTLERIDPAGPSDDANNWHTAAEQVGFATPGYRNSQFYPAIENGSFSYTSETVSPDNDGFEDILQINYQMAEAGYVGTFKIYDDRGRKIATVFDQELLGSEGTYKWDGVKDDGLKATIGTYIGIFEAFAPNGGAVYAERKAFVVAGQL